MKTKSKLSMRKTFGANLRREREARGLSREALTRKAGLHRIRIDTVERGGRNIGIDDIERLARALGLDLVSLMK
jgi:transcriptional regulator with XRE-family HTH domain